MRDALERARGDMCVIHYVDDFESAKKAFQDGDIQFFICDAPNNDEALLNREDKDTPARRFLHDILANFDDVPTYIIEDSRNPLLEEERLSYIKRGVLGFMRADAGDSDVLRRNLQEAITRSVEQHSLRELARANKVLSFETAQQLSGDKTVATISLFDLKLDVAADAGQNQKSGH